MRGGWRQAAARISGVSLAILWLAVGVLGCAPLESAPAAPPLPSDADATPATAQSLALGVTHSDGLDRAGGDLDDWYRVRVSRSGTLRIDLTATAKDGSVPQYTLVLTDETGARELARQRSGGRTRIQLTHAVGAGTYLVWVGTEPESPTPIVYEIRSSFMAAHEASHRPAHHEPVVRKERPPPPPPAPKFRTVTAPVVELENGQDGVQTIVVGAGEDQGLSPGLHGRVLEAGTELGTFQVTAVYPHGSRVRVDGRLKGPVTAKTVVEIRVPAGGSASGNH